jgi:hypothetical protein
METDPVPNERYLFLGGHRKCGTTMLLDLFDGHPDCCVYPTDLAVLYGYFPVWTAPDRSVEERLARLDLVVFGTLAKIRERHGLHDRLDVEAVRSDFFANLDPSGTDRIDVVVRQVIASYRRVTKQPVDQRPLTVVKETSLEIYARELGALFPDSQFIQLVRDPRDNMGALQAGVEKRYREIGENERHILASLIHRTGLGLRLVPANREALGDARFQTLSFEQLAVDADAVLDDLCRFIGLPTSPALRVPTVMGRPTGGNNFDGEQFKRVTARNVGRWRERTSEFAACVIEFHLGDVMEAHGYRLEFTPSERASAASEFYKWTNYEYFYRDGFKKLQGLAAGPLDESWSLRATKSD